MAKNDETEKGLEGSFVEALQYVGPRLISLVLGGNQAMATTDQMLKGIESDRLSKSKERMALQDREWSKRMDLAQLQQRREQGFARQQNKKYQQLQGVRDDQNRPLWGDPTTRTTYDVEGKEYTGKYYDPVSGRQKTRLTQRGEHFGKTFGLKKDKAGEISGKQVEATSAFNTALDTVNKVREAKKGIDTGPLAGRYASIKAATVGDPEIAKLNATITKLTADYIFAISGKAATDAERKMLERVVPQLNDPDVTFNSKLDTFEQMLRDGGEIFLETAKTGQPLKRPQIKKLLNILHKVEQGQSSQPKQLQQSTAPAGQSIIIKSGGKRKRISLQEARKRGFIK